MKPFQMKYNEDFRKDMPERVGEVDTDFDTSNYVEWLESELTQVKQERDSLKCCGNCKIDFNMNKPRCFNCFRGKYVKNGIDNWESNK